MNKSSSHDRAKKNRSSLWESSSDSDAGASDDGSLSVEDIWGEGTGYVPAIGDTPVTFPGEQPTTNRARGFGTTFTDDASRTTTPGTQDVVPDQGTPQAGESAAHHAGVDALTAENATPAKTTAEQTTSETEAPEAKATETPAAESAAAETAAPDAVSAHEVAADSVADAVAAADVAESTTDVAEAVDVAEAPGPGVVLDAAAAQASNRTMRLPAGAGTDDHGRAGAIGGSGTAGVPSDAGDVGENGEEPVGRGPRSGRAQVSRPHTAQRPGRPATPAAQSAKQAMQMVKQNTQSAKQGAQPREVPLFGSWLGWCKEHLRALLWGTAGFLAVVAIALYTLPIVAVGQVKVNGIHQLTYDDVIAISEIEPGENMMRLNYSAAAKRLIDDPWVEKVNVKPEFFNTVTIDITERTPILFVRGDVEGQDILVDTHGVAFTTAPAPLGAIELIETDTTNTKVLADIVAIVSALPDNVRMQIGSVAAHTPNTIMLNTYDDRHITVGDGSNAANKALAVATALQMPGRFFNVSNPQLIAVS